MAKHITKVVLTGGPAAGKTTLVSRVLKEFKQEDGWRVITIPETATELISGFGIKPFGGCMSMLAFQDFVVADQIHKEKLALDAAQLVPEENILILYDRALMDDKAYVTDEEFAQVIARFDGRTEERVLANYDLVLHLITCAKGAEFAYDLANNARTESIEYAREMDDRTLRAWSAHPNLRIIDNDANFNRKIERALREIYLKGFEIAIKESQPKAIMTSYNKVNGVHTANSYDLCTTAARKEWGFAGIIMTDWTTTNADGGSSAAKCIAAGNDLVMPGTDTDRREILDALSAENDQYLEEKDLTACAQRILEMIFTSNSYE